jgi:hypothetical protein
MSRKHYSLSSPWLTPMVIPPPHLRMKTVGKLLNHFLLLYLNTKTKTKTVKPDTKMNANLRNIENFENEPIRAKLCRTRSVYENSIWNTDPQCITINKCHRSKFRVQKSKLINLVSLTREKIKEKEKKLRCHRYWTGKDSNDA